MFNNIEINSINISPTLQDYKKDTNFLIFE